MTSHIYLKVINIYILEIIIKIILKNPKLFQLFGSLDDDDDQIPFDRFTDLQVILCTFFSWDLIFLGDTHFLEKYIFWGNSFLDLIFWGELKFWET